MCFGLSILVSSGAGKVQLPSSSLNSCRTDIDPHSIQPSSSEEEHIITLGIVSSSGRTGMKEEDQDVQLRIPVLTLDPS